MKIKLENICQYFGKITCKIKMSLKKMIYSAISRN